MSQPVLKRTVRNIYSLYDVLVQIKLLPLLPPPQPQSEVSLFQISFLTLQLISRLFRCKVLVWFLTCSLRVLIVAEPKRILQILKNPLYFILIKGWLLFFSPIKILNVERESFGYGGKGRPVNVVLSSVTCVSLIFHLRGNSGDQTFVSCF